MLKILANCATVCVPLSSTTVWLAPSVKVGALIDGVTVMSESWPASVYAAIF